MRRLIARVFRDAARRLDPPRPVNVDLSGEVMSRAQVEHFAERLIAASERRARQNELYRRSG